jgi:hypothetical protein
MSIALKGNPMARAKRGEGKEPPTAAVKIDRALVTKAKMIAGDKGVDLAQYLSDAMRAVVERDWAKMVRRIGNEGGGTK